MSSAPAYAERWATINFERRDGILQMRLHTNGGPLRWGADAVRDLQEAFGTVAADNENRVVILTGAGDSHDAKGSPRHFPSQRPRVGFGALERAAFADDLLDIEARYRPVNGPRGATRRILCFRHRPCVGHDRVLRLGYFVKGSCPATMTTHHASVGLNRRVLHAHGTRDRPRTHSTLALSRSVAHRLVVATRLEFAEQLTRQSHLVTPHAGAVH